ncbi:mCG141888, partial [Mus musculus]
FQDEAWTQDTVGTQSLLQNTVGTQPLRKRQHPVSFSSQMNSAVTLDVAHVVEVCDNSPLGGVCDDASRDRL